MNIEDIRKYAIDGKPIYFGEVVFVDTISYVPNVKFKLNKLYVHEVHGGTNHNEVCIDGYMYFDEMDLFSSKDECFEHVVSEEIESFAKQINNMCRKAVSPFVEQHWTSKLCSGRILALCNLMKRKRQLKSELKCVDEQ